jgi:hypothetical protein
MLHFKKIIFIKKVKNILHKLNFNRNIAIDLWA